MAKTVKAKEWLKNTDNLESTQRKLKKWLFGRFVISSSVIRSFLTHQSIAYTSNK